MSSTKVVPPVDSSQCLFNDFYDSDRSVSGSKSPQQMARPTEGFEISNGNERWIQSCSNGSNLLTYLYKYITQHSVDFKSKQHDFEKRVSHILRITKETRFRRFHL